MKCLLTNSFVVTLLVCLSVKYATCIKCYDCETIPLDGADDPKCKQCSASVCNIVIRTQENGEGFITRSCLSDTNGTLIGGEVNSGEDHGQFTAGGVHVSWRTCTTDLCNWDVTHGHRIRRQIDQLSGLFNGVDAPKYLYPGLGATGGKSGINCFSCQSNPIDYDDKKCLENNSKDSVPCPSGACRIFKVAFEGDSIIYRTCDNPGFSKIIPKKNDLYNDKITRFGVTLSWSRCTTDLCNWGVMNKYQMMTLFVSAMLSLTVYTIF